MREVKVEPKVTSISWPNSPPAGMKPFRWMLDGGGRDLVVGIINRNGMRSVLEIGVFLGGGALKLLDACPQLHLHGLDIYDEPYPEAGSIGHYYLSNRRIYQSAIEGSGISEDDFLRQMSRPNAQIDSMLSNLWHYRTRFTAVKGKSPGALHGLASEGYVPDLVFLDADKSGSELRVISSLWPECIIAGDDWTWRNDSGVNPLHSVVYNIAAQREMSVITQDATWVLEPHSRQLV